MFSLLILVLTCASAFEYFKAVIHSQDVTPLPHREVWHPHLYLVRSASGDQYELRNSLDYYDVSISFLQTGETAPGILNCECRFVLDEVEDEGLQSPRVAHVECDAYLLQIAQANVTSKRESSDEEGEGECACFACTTRTSVVFALHR